MTPEDLAYLYSRSNEYRSIRYDLRNMQALVKALGNPQEAFRSVLIAGTNGKGSVARFLSATMPEAGLYTSPHLRRLNERIRIGEKEISDEDLKIVFEQVKAAVSAAKDLLYPPTYFEFVTAMAFLYFRDRVKLAVLEVGLGGRLDATNVVKQDVSVITSIGFDHQEFLGTTIESIATEKAGIIKESEPVVIGPTADLPPIRARAGSRLIRSSEFREVAWSLGGGYFQIGNLRPRLLGRHQVENVRVAATAAECLKLDESAIVRGINMATWPGRLEQIGRFVLDGAHNIPAARALADFLDEFYPQGVWMIFGAMADKQFEEMLSILKPHVHQFIFTKAQTSRAKDPIDLQKLVAGSHVEPSSAAAISFAQTQAPAATTVVICGSLYLIGEARAVLE